MESELIIQGFIKENDHYSDIPEISRFRRDFINNVEMNRLQELYPNCHVIFWIDVIDNSDLGYGMTFKGCLGVYSTSERKVASLLGGFGDSSPWCLSIDEAERQAVIDYLHKQKIDSSYRNRENQWRNLLR